MKNHKYTTTFSSVIKPVVSEDKDKYLALASMVELEKFLPDVDIEKNIDLLPIAFNAFVANRVNKNGDVVDTETAVAMHDNFINKPINIEHNRKSIVGLSLPLAFPASELTNRLQKSRLRKRKNHSMSRWGEWFGKLRISPWLIKSKVQVIPPVKITWVLAQVGSWVSAIIIW